MEVSNETAEKLEEFSQKNGLDHDDVVEAFKEKYTEVEEKASNVDEDYLETLALRAVRTAELSKFGGTVEGVEMATIGGGIRVWGDDDDPSKGPERDVFIGKALVDINPNEEGGRDYVSSVVADSDDGVDVSEFYSAFSEVGNIVTGEFSISDAFSDNFKVLNADNSTELSVTVPDNKNGIIKDIRNAVPETDIANIADNRSAEQRNDDGNVYPADFGVDVRRMTVDIYDGYKNPEGGFGMYTVRDDTVFDDDDIVESPVFDAANSNENATPGMTCFMDVGDMEYATNSVVEMYGVISKSKDGVIQMNVDGVVPILDEGEFDGYVDNRDSNSSPEREETSSNVDRKSI
jgi:hypothetical protein